MGALPRRDGEEPTEEPAETTEDGCPGAWYRCGFVASLYPFERHVSGDGVYSENITLSRCTDPLVLEAIHYLEHERARSLGHQREKMSTT